MACDSSCDSLSLPISQSTSAGPAAFFRPFPPPALENVPLPYILEQLHNLATHYWDKPDTADCTIIIPLPSVTLTRQPSTTSTNLDFNNSFPPALNSDPAGLGVAGPSATRVTRMTSKLHLDYLLAQSSLFRNLFSGRSPLEHLALPSSSANASISVPLQCLPRIVPSETSQPTVYLPVPHPQSFPHLVHYMYFGTTELLEDALDQKIFRWEDVVRNVEFLGMRSRIKVFLGHWYARSRIGGSCSPLFEEDRRYDSEGDEYDEGSSEDSDVDSEADSDVDFSDVDMDDEDAPTTCTSDDNLDIECSSKSMEKNALRSHRSMGVLGNDEEDDDAPRGRTRTRTVPSTPVRSPRRTRL